MFLKRIKQEMFDNRTLDVFKARNGTLDVSLKQEMFNNRTLDVSLKQEMFNNRTQHSRIRCEQ